MPFSSCGSCQSMTSLGVCSISQGYVARDLASLVADEAVRDEADLAGHEGYYLARSLRFEFMRATARLGAGIRKIKLENGELVMSRLFGGNPRRLIPAVDGGFRFDKDLGPTVYFEEEGGENQLLGENSFTRISAVVAWLIPVLVSFAVLIMLSSVLYGLIWIPKAILRKYPDRQALLLRAWPLAASLTLIGGVALLVNLFGAPFPDIIFDALARPGLDRLVPLHAGLSCVGNCRVGQLLANFTFSCWSAGAGLPCPCFWCAP